MTFWLFFGGVIPLVVMVEELSKDLSYEEAKTKRTFVSTKEMKDKRTKNKEIF